jgi:phosphate uptake regulator
VTLLGRYYERFADHAVSVARRVLSFWLLLGLAPPALYELWLVWPQLTA